MTPEERRAAGDRRSTFYPSQCFEKALTEDSGENCLGGTHLHQLGSQTEDGQAGRPSYPNGK